MGKKPVLGKGLNALIPELPDSSGSGDGARQIVYIHIDEIERNPLQARTEFDEERINELMQSIQEKGVIQPIVVNRVGQGYQLIAGERRWRATQKARIQEIPALVHENESQQDMMELSLIENIHEKLKPKKKKKGARKGGKNRTTVANLLRLLNLPHEIQDFLRRNQLQMGHARALLGLDDDDDKLEFGRRAVEENLSVREVERAVSSKRQGRDKKHAPAKVADTDPHIRDFEERLQHRFGTGVNIRRAANKGRIEVEFYDDSDLERILELLLTDE